MESKDYYTILGIGPSATIREIKGAYRRLAQQYHPDKTNNDPYAAARFDLIKEAYEVLSNPSKKDQYLQQRWYEQSAGKRGKTQASTPVTLLQQVLELDRHISATDTHRMDRLGLFAYMANLLSDEQIGMLNRFGEMDINETIAARLLHCGQSFRSREAQSLAERLKKLSLPGSFAVQITRYLQRTRNAERWNRYGVWVILLAVILFCVLMYKIG